MKLKDYQNEAVQELLVKSWNLLSQKDGTLVFQSPTGSGKTIVIAEFLKRLSEKSQQLIAGETRQPLSFVWIAPRKLHEQSKRKLEKHYINDHALECNFFDDLSSHEVGKGHEIGEGEILFLNWESVNREEINNFIKGDEKGNSLDKIIERTIDAGKKIVLIVDESHHSASTEIAKDLINILRLRLSIYVSATPGNKSDDGRVVIQIEDVKKEEMIKKSLVLNDGFNSDMQDRKIRNDLPTNKNLKELVLEEALKKREELANAFLEEGHHINPLLLVQLPDRMKEESGDPVMDETIAILKNNGVTKKNKKLAIHLSEMKENTENIEWDNKDVDVLLFKQAIALGWDCPRAHILVLFREWSSQVFSIQTLGRIMRVPIPDVGYFNNEILNHGYVYTSHEEIEIAEDFDKNDVSTYKSLRKDDYKDIVLPSIYRKRQRDKTRLDPNFIDIFQEEAGKYDLKNKIKIEGQEVIRKIIEETHFEDVDRVEAIKGRLEIGNHSTDDLQAYFDYFIKENIYPLYPEGVSMARVRSSIYRFLKEKCNVLYADHSLFDEASEKDSMRYRNDFEKAISIAISEKNEGHFAYVIQKSIEEYQREKEKKGDEFVLQPYWNVPKSIPYGCDYIQEEKSKSIMQPFYRHKNASNTEEQFINRLENSEKVAWWFKNGDHGSMYFAVPYEESGKKHLFYVDFVVLLENGKIMLYDTKDGFTLESAQEKAKGLSDYICEQKNIGGGIVTKDNNTWRISPKDASNIGKEHLQEWDFLEEI